MWPIAKVQLRMPWVIFTVVRLLQAFSNGIFRTYGCAAVYNRALRSSSATAELVVFSSFLISPHRSTRYVDVGYCCRPGSMVCLSVGLSRSWALQKPLNCSRCRLNCGVDSGAPKEPRYMGSRSPCEGAILKGAAYCKVWGLPYELCKTAEPIKKSFRMWIRVGPS